MMPTARRAKRWGRIGAGVLAARLDRGSIPLHASLAVTWRCNYSCSYCGRANLKGDELDTRQWCAVLDELYRLGCLELSITGGEPLLRPDLGEILACASRRGLRVNLNTNGARVPERLEEVRHAHRVTISLDGTPAIHDAQRGAGAYEAVQRAADALSEAQIPMSFYTVLSRHNLDRLDAVLAEARRRSARVVFQPGTAIALDGCTPNQDAPEPEAYREAIDRLIAWKRAGEPVGNSEAALRYLQRWPTPQPIQCAWRMFCRIDPDGGMHACGRDGQTGLPNVRDHGVAGALKQRQEPRCGSCWSAARVEAHLLTAGEPGVLRERLLGLLERPLGRRPIRP